MATSRYPFLLNFIDEIYLLPPRPYDSVNEDHYEYLFPFFEKLGQVEDEETGDYYHVGELYEDIQKYYRKTSFKLLADQARTLVLFLGDDNGEISKKIQHLIFSRVVDKDTLENNRGIETLYYKNRYQLPNYDIIG